MRTMKNPVSTFMASRTRALRHVSRKFPKFHDGMSTADYVMRFAELNKYNTRFDGHGVEVLPYDLSGYMHPCAIPQGPDVIVETI